MYTSTNNNGHSSFTSTSINQPITSSSCFLYNYENETNLSKPPQEHYYPHYINALEDESIFRDIFQQPLSSEIVATMEQCSNNTGQIEMKPKDDSLTKRCKKDRHSKINTAQGPRDRRMRLSLDVAKKFFRLQDMLGFDKASKTIEWLITKSNHAIQELLPHPLGVSNSASSTSDCEVLSGVDDQETTNKDKAKCSSFRSKEKKKVIRRSAHVHHPHAKETRERARARARERTMDKKINKNFGYGGAYEYQYSKFRPYNSDEPIFNQVQTINQSKEPCLNSQFEQGIVGDNSYLMMQGNWSPSFFFNYQQNAGVSLEHQFNDFQILGKPWEGNNN